MLPPPYGNASMVRETAVQIANVTCAPVTLLAQRAHRLPAPSSSSPVTSAATSVGAWRVTSA